MWLNLVFAKLNAKCRALVADEGGNFAMIFALTLVPVVSAVGVGVDYSRAGQAHSQLQAAADATALAVSSNAPSQSASQLQSSAQNFFSGVFNNTNVTGLAVNATYSNSGGSQVTVTASAQLKTMFMKIAGLSSMNISTSSTTAWGTGRLRVALVLDNTGSMNDYGKITALKTATNNMLTQFKNAAVNNGDVYVSIIPFVKDVAVDPINYNQSWIDWTDWDANNGTCSNGGSGNGNGNGWAWGLGGGGSTQASCNGTWTPANHNTWNGCITDRGNSNAPSGNNYDTNVVAPANGNPASQFPAENYGACPAKVMGLNYNWSTMTTAVNNMVANGNTNQAVGLAWGWLSLVGGGPFTVPPMDPNYQYTQVIILLTDGLNTQDRWYSNQTSIDNRQQMTCNNIKAAGITLYTIQVNTDGDPTSTLLQNCASTSSQFFLLTSANQIVTTFSQIGTKLSQLRIAK
jgi:Flp pilus assembly protein TadG